HAAEKAVDDPDLRARRWNERPGLRQDRDQRRLAKKGRLAPHVRPGDQPQPIVAAHRQIVRHEPLTGLPERTFDDRVSTAFDLQTSLVGELWGGPATLSPATPPRSRATAARA